SGYADKFVQKFGLNLQSTFFHIMKAEAFYQKETDTYETLVSQISVWIDDYNFSRIKTKLGCKSPIEYRIFTT
ncbi:IS3 family transposase, partial [Latilactobacillus curvatus]